MSLQKFCIYCKEIDISKFYGRNKSKCKSCENEHKTLKKRGETLPLPKYERPIENNISNNYKVSYELETSDATYISEIESLREQNKLFDYDNRNLNNKIEQNSIQINTLINTIESLKLILIENTQEINNLKESYKKLEVNSLSQKIIIEDTKKEVDNIEIKLAPIGKQTVLGFINEIINNHIRSKDVKNNLFIEKLHEDVNRHSIDIETIKQELKEVPRKLKPKSLLLPMPSLSSTSNKIISTSHFPF